MESIYVDGVEIIQSFQSGALSKMKLIIHHQFPGIELVSPIYAGDGVTCYLPPDQKVDVDATTQAGFNIDPDQEKPVGILMYKLQRKNINQSNEEIISNEGEATCTQLVIVWKVKSSEEFSAAPFLIEHDKGGVWNKDKLTRLVNYCEIYGARYGSIEKTWLMHDSRVLMTRMNVTRKGGYYELETIISETSIEFTYRLIYLDLDT
jgi:hypothetical protein